MTRLESHATDKDPRQVLLDSPLSRYQIVAIAVTVALYALDGFDVLAVTYAAPGFLNEWGLSKAELGLALSMGLVGMGLGSFFISPLADIIGRRFMVFVCLALMSSGMLATAFSQSLIELSAWRVYTGLGIGAMVSILNPLAAEYSNARQRDLSIGLIGVGFPIGGTLGGIAAAMLLEAYDWRAIFLFGGVLALVMIPVAWLYILEPVGFLINKPKPDSLTKVNTFLARCRLAPITALPQPATNKKQLPFVEIFNSENIKVTVHITLLYALYMMTVYFFLSWTPQLVADLGFSPAVSAGVAVTRDLTGILGGALLGWAAHYLGLKRLTIIAVAGMGLALVLFGQLAADIVMLNAVAAVAGLFLYAGMIGLNAIVSRTFATHVRATGTGFVIGVGRVSSALAPLLGGYLFTSGLDRDEVTAIMAICALLSALLLLAFRVKPISTH